MPELDAVFFRTPAALWWVVAAKSRDARRLATLIEGLRRGPPGRASAAARQRVVKRRFPLGAVFLHHDDLRDGGAVA